MTHHSHTVWVDSIVRATGPGWTLAKARLLIDSEGNAALFTPPKGSAPVQVFTVDVSQPRLAKQGAGTQDGGAVSFTTIGSSCGYALAKCNTKPEVLVRAWDKLDRSQETADAE
jgi:hypothetical protein